MSIFRKFVKFCMALHILLMSSCSTIESTLDSTWDSISEAGDYIYDSVNFWEETEPEQSEAIIIEEAVEVPEYAMPDLRPQNFAVQPSFTPQQAPTQPYYDPIYRSARQYYFVGPNGTPMLAPQPPPFPQYSIDQVSPVLPYSYNNNLNLAPPALQTPNNSNLNLMPEKQVPRMLSEDEEMELFGIQNNCIQVAKDLVNGGYVCDDFD